MIQSKIELKLLKIMELIHEQKVRLIEEKPVLYSSLADINLDNTIDVLDVVLIVNIILN